MWRSLELNFSSPFKTTSFWKYKYSLIFFCPTLFIYFYLLLLIFFLFMSNEIIETFFIFSCFGLLRQMKHQFFIYLFFFSFDLLYLFIFIYFCWFSSFLCLTKLLRHFLFFLVLDYWGKWNINFFSFLFFPIIRKEVAIENVEHLKEIIFN